MERVNLLLASLASASDFLRDSTFSLPQVLSVMSSLTRLRLPLLRVDSAWARGGRHPFSPVFFPR